MGVFACVFVYVSPIGLSMCGCAQQCHIEVSGQLVSVISCLPPCWLLGLSSRPQAWQEVPLLTELSCQPSQKYSKYPIALYQVWS